MESLDMAQSVKDKSGLGRWTTVTLQGDNIKTRIVCEYTVQVYHSNGEAEQNVVRSAPTIPYTHQERHNSIMCILPGGTDTPTKAVEEGGRSNNRVYGRKRPYLPRDNRSDISR